MYLDAGEYDVLVLGEVLFDVYLQHDDAVNVDSPVLMRAFPGGAPANVAVALTKLGRKAAFLGGISDDLLGQRLRSVLSANGVEVSLAFEATNGRTPLSIVGKDERGDPDFRMYWDNTAALAVPPEHIEQCLIPGGRGRQPRVIHLGPLLLTGEPGASSTWRLMELAGSLGITRSCDLNVRPNLWQDVTMAKRLTLQLATKAEVIKLSDRDGEFLFGEIGEREMARRLFEVSDTPRLVAVTSGERGALLANRHVMVKVLAYPAKSIDPTGAGDAFTAGLLSGILPELEEQGPDFLDRLGPEELGSLGWTAAVAGALATTTHGAMGALPTIDQLRELLASRKDVEWVRDLQWPGKAS